MTGDFDFKHEENDAKDNQRHAGVIYGERIERIERKNKTDNTYDTGKNQSGIIQFKDQSPHTEHHKDIGEIRIAEEVEEGLTYRWLNRYYFHVFRSEGPDAF